MNKLIRICVAVLAIAFVGAVGYAWAGRQQGIDVSPANIEKVTEKGDATSTGFCASFQMTPAQFRDYFKRVRPVSESERHGYDWFPCYYKAAANGKEYRIRLGGLAEVIEHDGKVAAYHCADEGAKKCSVEFPFSADKN